ncbi:hypothetical protein JCM10908_003398 [Rhodotorula pacifica]|uniref:DUF6534 domain-containing protein n=1 Tax=Rhodotorula pacifica TaxID=1495444 RepID=UPI003174774A
MPGIFGVVDEPTVSAPQKSADFAMGPAQAGYLAQILLFGVLFSLCLQCWISGDLARTGKLGRGALAASLVLNAAYTGVCFYEAYIAAVWQDRRWQFISNADLTFNALPLLASLCAAVTEVLLPHAWCRIAFSVWISLLVLAVLTGGILACYIGVIYYYDATSVPIQWGPSSAIWLWASAIADVSISLACAWSLRSRIAGFNRGTDSVLRTLIFIVLRTAAYTAIISVVGAVVESIYSDDELPSYIGNAFWLPTPALYGIALFTFSVSSRRVIDSRLGIVGTPDGPPSLERKPQLSTTSASHRSITIPSMARLSRARSVDPGATRSPLMVTVHQEREIYVEEDTDGEGISHASSKRPRGGPSPV